MTRNITTDGRITGAIDSPIGFTGAYCHWTIERIGLPFPDLPLVFLDVVHPDNYASTPPSFHNF